MVNFVVWLFDSFYELLFSLSANSVKVISNLFDESFIGNDDLYTIMFNLTLFSDTPILSMSVYDFMLLFFTIFYTVIFVVIVWKIIKKVFVKITGWHRW